jgi:hypothetical protein
MKVSIQCNNEQDFINYEKKLIDLGFKWGKGYNNHLYDEDFNICVCNNHIQYYVKKEFFENHARMGEKYDTILIDSFEDFEMTYNAVKLGLL